MKSHTFKFFELCELALERETQRVRRQEITKLSLELFEGKVRNYLLPAFGGQEIEQISSAEIRSLAERLQEKLKRSTVRQILLALRKVLQHGHLIGRLDRLPNFPRLKSDSVPRGGFDAQEYLTLWRAAKKMLAPSHERLATHRDRRGGLFAKDTALHPDMPDLIRFMVNCFIRPTDLKWMQHKHIQRVEGRHRYLRLELPESKRHTTQIVSMQPAVSLYKKLHTNAEKRRLGGPNDYVFFPEISDRKVAMMVADVQFRRLLEATGLRIGKRGQIRTLYSLRHTSIMFRLRYGRGIDLLTLARNARTSVEMVDKFYASELTAEMNVDLLQSRRAVK